MLSGAMTRTPPGDEDRHDRAVEVGPGGLAVQQQRDRAVGRPLVEVVHPHRVQPLALDVEVVRLEGEAGQAFEAPVGGPQDIVHT